MTRQEFIFSPAYPARIARHTVFWGAYYFFSLFTYFHDGFEKLGFRKWALLESVENFFHLATQILFCYGIIYFIVPRFINRKKYVKATLLTLLWSGLVYFLYYFEHILFFKRIHFYVGLPFRPPDIVYWFTLISFLSYFPVSTGLALAIKALKTWYLKQLENQMLTRENANAELQLLKAQVHPHFLFNTLNNIYSFALNKAKQTPALVKKLSDTIHYMIHECETPLVPLQKEIKMIRDYMELESIRYGSRLNMQVEIKGNCENKLITPLLMIPFVENSFKHGTSQVLQQPWIAMEIIVEENEICFKLRNSKPSKISYSNKKNGIGLTNVAKRLKLLYPAQHQLEIQSLEDEFSVEMKLPVETRVADKPAIANQFVFQA